MYKFFLALVSFLFLITPKAQAEEVSTETKLVLQDLMNQYIDEISEDGKMIYLDTKSDKLNALYFASAQPMYVPDKGNYLLCTSGFDEEGQEHIVDFYAQDVGGDYKILDVSVDNCRCFGRQSFNLESCRKSCMKILVNFFCIETSKLVTSVKSVMNMEEKTQLTNLVYEDQKIFEVLEKVLLSGSVSVIDRNNQIVGTLDKETLSKFIYS